MYLEGVEAETFDWREYLAQFDPRLLADTRGRRELCKYDPLLWALIYFRHHLASDETDGVVSFSDFHLDLCRDALYWASRKPKEKGQRHAYVAARGSGKSTWLFLILPMWALAYKHRRFVAAFADSGPQASQHLISFKRELDTNELLRKDQPLLCAPVRRPSGVTVADTQTLLVAASGVTFQAKGIDSSTLGSKVGSQRPDLLLFDDIEPDESNYAGKTNDRLYQKRKRLHSITHSVFPMNTRAAVFFSGTVVMTGSIMHDIVRYAQTPDADDLEAWVREEKIKPRYYPLLVTGPDGEPKSTWPQRYPSAYCVENAHTSSFKLNMQNNPRGKDGGYWTEEDFVYEVPDEKYTRWLLEVDPAVTTKITSDYTGLAVVACSPKHQRPGEHARQHWPVACVVDSWQVKLVGDKLRERVLRILELYPRIRLVRAEVNQGGEYIAEALHDLPVKVVVHTSTVAKDVRMAWALDHYQRRRVTHARPQRLLEEEMIGYPEAGYDDIADAACSGILHFLARPEPLQVRTKKIETTG